MTWARLLLGVVLLQPLAPGLQPKLLELRGRVLLPKNYQRRTARVTIFSVSSPFLAQKPVLHKGTFKFPKLEPGPYTVAVAVRGVSEVRQTIDVSPSMADAKGRVYVELQMEGRPAQAGAAIPGAMVSVRQLSIPEKARQEYRKAVERLSKHDAPGGIRHLEKAVTLAPQFAEALNTLGTIYNQTRDYPKAEECFREALRVSPSSFEPLVNLGGVLLALRRPLEALLYNREAVEARPNDALAQCQLGWSYLETGKPEEAVPHFQQAKKLDPGHFSRPQLGLAEIYNRRSQPLQAAGEMEEYLRLHPDDPDASKIRAKIFELRTPKR